MSLLQDTVFLGTFCGTATVKLSSFVEIYAVMRYHRKRNKEGRKCRRLCIQFNAMHDILDIECGGMDKLLKKTIWDAQPEQLAVECSVVMLKDWSHIQPLKLDVLMIYINCPEDLFILPRILSACAESLTYLEIGLGCYTAGTEGYRLQGRLPLDEDDVIDSNLPLPPLPQLRRLCIHQCWTPSQIQEWAQGSFTNLIKAIPSTCLLGVARGCGSFDAEGHAPIQLPWDDRLKKQEAARSRKKEDPPE